MVNGLRIRHQKTKVINGQQINRNKTSETVKSSLRKRKRTGSHWPKQEGFLFEDSVLWNNNPNLVKNDQRSKCQIFCQKQRRLIIAIVTHSIKLGSHTWFQIKRIPVTSLDMVVPSLALFDFVLLNYYFCDIFPDMLAFLFCILFRFFHTIKITKIRSIIMIKLLLSLTNNNPNRYVTHYAHYYSSITYLSYLSPFRFSLPSLWYLFSLHYMKKEARPSTGDYTSTFDHQITTFILAKTIRFRV